MPLKIVGRPKPKTACRGNQNKVEDSGSINVIHLKESYENGFRKKMQSYATRKCEPNICHTCHPVKFSAEFIYIKTLRKKYIRG